MLMQHRGLAKAGPTVIASFVDVGFGGVDEDDNASTTSSTCCDRHLSMGRQGAWGDDDDVGT